MTRWKLLAIPMLLMLLPAVAHAGNITGTVVVSDSAGDASGVLVQLYQVTTPPTVPSLSFLGAAALLLILSFAFLRISKQRPVRGLSIALLALSATLAFADVLEDSLTTSASGGYWFQAEGDTEYRLDFSKSGYDPVSMTFTTDSDGNYETGSVVLSRPLPDMTFGGVGPQCTNPNAVLRASSLTDAYPREGSSSGGVLVFPGSGLRVGVRLCCQAGNTLPYFGLSDSPVSLPTPCGSQVQAGAFEGCNGDDIGVTIDLSPSELTAMQGGGCSSQDNLYVRDTSTGSVSPARSYLSVAHVYTSGDYSLSLPGNTFDLETDSWNISATLPAKMPFETIQLVAEETTTQESFTIATLPQNVVPGTVGNTSTVQIVSGWDGAPLPPGSYEVSLEITYHSTWNETPYTVGPEALTVTGPELEVNEITYSGGITLHDLQYTPVPTPQYQKGRADQYAAAYVRNATGGTTVKIEWMNTTTGGNISRELRAVDPDNLFAPGPVDDRVIIEAATYNFTEAQPVATATPNINIPDEITYIPELLWQYRAVGATNDDWRDLPTKTDNPVCGTNKAASFNAPGFYFDPDFAKPLEQIVLWSCQWLAEDISLPTSPTDKQVMDSLFVARRKGHKFDDVGIPLEYNYTGSSPLLCGGSLTISLLDNGKETCGAWAYFLTSLARSQGVAGSYQYGFTLTSISGNPNEVRWPNLWLTTSGVNQSSWSNIFKRRGSLTGNNISDPVGGSSGNSIVSVAPMYVPGGTPSSTLEDWSDLSSSHPLKLADPYWWSWGNHAITLLDFGGNTYVYDPSFEEPASWEIELGGKPPSGSATYTTAHPRWDFVERYYQQRTLYTVGKIEVSRPFPLPSDFRWVAVESSGVGEIGLDISEGVGQ